MHENTENFKTSFLGSKREQNANKIMPENSFLKRYKEKPDLFSFMCIWSGLWSVGGAAYCVFWRITHYKEVVLKSKLTAFWTSLEVTSVYLTQNLIYGYNFIFLNLTLRMTRSNFTKNRTKHAKTLPIVGQPNKEIDLLTDYFIYY